jgi:hypothetical protein
MGALGRSVLYASFALSVSVSAAMAASQGAVPGDAPLPAQAPDRTASARGASCPPARRPRRAFPRRAHPRARRARRAGDWARVAGQAAAVEDEYRHFPTSHGARRLVGSTPRRPDRVPRSASRPGAARDRGRARWRRGCQRRGGRSRRPWPGRRVGRQQRRARRPGQRGPGATRRTADAAGPIRHRSRLRPARPDPTPRASKSPRPSADPAAPSAPTSPTRPTPRTTDRPAVLQESEDGVEANLYSVPAKGAG